MDLATTVRNAEREIRWLIRQECQDGEVFSFGAIDISPRHLAIWITTKSDQDRDRLRANRALLAELRAVLINVGYPFNAVPNVGFAFESQETVDRDYNGSWYNAVK